MSMGKESMDEGSMVRGVNGKMGQWDEVSARRGVSGTRSTGRGQWDEGSTGRGVNGTNISLKIS